VRELRGLSRSAAAEAIQNMDGECPITARVLELFESDGRLPQVRGMISRLDMLYGMDGRLGVERWFSSETSGARDRRGRYIVKFPQYWRGPVWIQLWCSDPTKSGDLELIWGPWRRQQRVRSGAAVTTMKASTSPDGSTLLVRAPEGWKVVAGTGSAPGSLNIMKGWSPVGIHEAGILIRAAVEMADRARRSLENGSRQS
jgi:hypothetical protein